MDPVAGRRPDVAVDIEPEAVRDAGLHDVEDARPFEPAPVDDVERHDVVAALDHPRIRHVERPLVEREREPVGVDEGVGRDRQLAGRAVQPEHEAATQLGVGLVALPVVEDPVRRIGEPDRSVRGDDDVVRRVEPPALVPVDDGRAAAIGLVARDASQAVLAGEDAPVVVERVAVGEIGRAVEVGDAVGGRPAMDDVAPHVAPDQGVLARHVDGPLGPQTAARVPDEFGVGRDEALEARIAHDPLDRTRRHGHDAESRRRDRGAHPGARPGGARDRARS